MTTSVQRELKNFIGFSVTAKGLYTSRAIFKATLGSVGDVFRTTAILISEDALRTQGHIERIVCDLPWK